jgi:SAM-dependent MidA family methyltransferase
MDEVEQIIAREIAAGGVISFARFMELALYCPEYGYYEMEKDTIGRSGDYYTSVSVGDLFGRLLALQFAEWLQADADSGGESGKTAKIVEAGAHDGRLAADILHWLQTKRPRLFERLEYWIIEPSDRRRAWQRQTLGDMAGQTRWAGNLAEAAAADPGSRIRGIIFTNEFLDALPVHRWGWNKPGHHWFEWGVTLKQDQFAWEPLESTSGIGATARVAAHAPGLRPHRQPSGLAAPSLPEELLAVLPDGFTVETCPAAETWWREAGERLACGRLMTIDYGLTEEEFFAPHRGQGTLRAYCRHHVTTNLLAQPGKQDLTASIDFSAIESAGKAAGLQTEAFLTQSQFLTRIAGRIWQGEIDFGAWTPQDTRQFQTLTHPQHLGRPFHVLVQRRD